MFQIGRFVTAKRIAMDPIMIAPRIVGLFIELLRLGRLPLLVMENAKIVCG
jgi:hypothetical protein